MNIWKWVQDTQNELIQQENFRLVGLIEQLPSYTVDEKHLQLDAIVPEALALARSIKNPWLEVFIRHWNLQSRVAHRFKITEMLPEAIDLLAFSNRDDTRDCPQSICVVQDIGICYGFADGPGYVEERLAVAQETLDKIDATWPCFTCISGEYVSALLDDKQYQEGLNFLEKQAQALLLIQGYERRFHMRSNWVEVFIRLQRYEEAKAFNQEAVSEGSGESYLLERDIDNARITAYMGEYKEAKAILPHFEKIINSLQHCVHWAETVRILANNDAIHNDWSLNAQFQQMVNQLSENGVIRKAFTIALWQAELALKRGSINTAERCCDKAEALIPRLRKPLDAPQLLIEMRDKITATPTNIINISLEKSPEQVISKLGEDQELNIDILEEGIKRWPEHELLVVFNAQAYEKIGESQQALEILRQYLDSYPNSAHAVEQYGKLLLNAGQRDELQAFVSNLFKRDLNEEIFLYGHQLLVKLYQKNGDLALAKQHLSAIIEKSQNFLETQNFLENRTLLAKLERKTGHLEVAIFHLDWIVERFEEAGNYDWDRMVVATLLEDWDKVRHSAERLGFKDLPKNGPIDEAWELCRIQFVEPSGEHVTYFARRTGPVTAHVLGIASPENTQHFLDQLVFEPNPLNEGSESESENESEKFATYAVIQITEPGNYICYTLDGIHPGKEALQELRNALKDLYCHYQVQSGSRYQLFVGEESLLGIYAYLAVPETQPLQSVTDLLTTITQNYAHPLTWLGMAKQLGDKAEIERQKVIIEKYGI
jgi:tetratricopeptide (TPR) repeat protein